MIGSCAEQELEWYSCGGDEEEDEEDSSKRRYIDAVQTQRIDTLFHMRLARDPS